VLRNTLDNVIVHVRCAKALLAAQRFDEAQEHAKAALAFARRIDAAIGPTWVQNVSEMIALPFLLDKLQFHAEAEEMRNRFAPPPRLRLLRFHSDTRFSFK